MARHAMLGVWRARIPSTKLSKIVYWGIEGDADEVPSKG